MVAVINVSECVGCGTCIDECPAEAITLNGENIAVVDANECLDCGACVDVCPTSAISME
ncbi:MAG: 4Fe-4S binding protein [Methanomethylovorans sp.]|uniref:4Fe-4S binding protein n=1 Tax=Methanomethylovorans sp. TaxID=2758717 RepID=UPI0009C59DE9|nr:MAG: Ferredoxin [Methanomethylovorans sp. PtaU1.Bin073]